MSSLGAVFKRLSEQRKLWRNLYFVALVVVLALNVVVRPEESEYGLDAYPGFFAAFGLVIGAVLLLVMDKIVRPLIARKEDFYGDL